MHSFHMAFVLMNLKKKRKGKAVSKEKIFMMKQITRSGTHPVIDPTAYLSTYPVSIHLYYNNVNEIFIKCKPLSCLTCV